MSDPSTVSPSPQSPPSWLFALLAGAASFVGVPIGFTAFFLLLQPRSSELGEESYGSPLRDAWNEGGSTMYLVLVGAMLASVIIAALLAAATRASTALATGLPFLAVLPALAGAAGAKWGLDDSVLAVAHANPLDRVTILFGSAGEALMNSLFGSAVSGGLAIAVALGLVLGSIGRARDPAPAQRHAMIAGALVALSFAAVCFVGAAAIRELAGLCKALAYSGASMQELASAAVPELGGLQRAWSGSLLAALIAVLVGAGVMRAPVPGRVAFAASALLGLGLLALGSKPHVPADFKQVAVGDEAAPQLLAFDAPPLSGAGLSIGEDSAADTAEHVRTSYQRWHDLHSYVGDDSGSFGLDLTLGLSGETLAAALEALWQEGARSVILFTAPTTKPISELPPPFDVISPSARGVRLELGARSECPDPCEFAQLADGTLVSGGEKWPLEGRADVETPTGGQPVLLPLEPRAPLELLRAAITAMKHQRALKLVSSHERELAREESPPVQAAPSVKIELVSLSAVGPLDVKVARPELVEQLEALARCVDPAEDLDRLPLATKVELSINSNGGVLGAEVEGKTDDPLLDCLRSELPVFLNFSPPRTRGLSIARVGLRFSPAAKKAP